MGRIVSLVAIAFMLAATHGHASAQESSPADYPLTPDPADCRVAPRPIESVIAVVGTPVAADLAMVATPPAFVRPSGEPADAETTGEVVATVREVFACANAGDFLRVYALFTDDYLREFLAGTPISEEVIAFFTASPVPLPAAEKRVIVRVGEVQLLADGRAGLVVVLDEPEDPRTEEPDYLMLKLVGDRWLVDEVVEDGGLSATPSPATPAP